MKRSQTTINRTIKTAQLIDAFWDRWIVHGVDKEEINAVRSSLTSAKQWTEVWARLAEEKRIKAQQLKEDERKEAEQLLRQASLYFNVAQWIFPECDREKLKWYESCLACTREADQLSEIETKYVTFEVDHHLCYGRVRTPLNPIGCIIIFNPIDSSKEELFMYEEDFLRQGMMTVSFDGPGQGETFIRQEFQGTLHRLKAFADQLIDYTRSITELPIYLFGTSSGANWAVYGGSHPEVNKVVAVSPTDRRNNIFVPDYFNGRLAFFLAEFELVPDYRLSFRTPVLIYHGKKDAMVSSSFIYSLFNTLPTGKRLIEFEDEGHCCNFRLKQIRNESVSWFTENDNAS
ncbi:alpha/beta hydrolase [bacterium LRH843]|nr:alpha/beta hydrolase [bacterium LRH843]